MLTSQAREILRSVETVIVDEIHALAPTKRGAHLALSLERLDAIADAPPQRIGLSATQRPLDEIARFLGGQTDTGARPVTIVDAGSRKELDIEVIVPVDDMTQPGVHVEAPGAHSQASGATANALGLDTRRSRQEHLAARAPASARADPRPPHHHRVLQRAPHGRAARGAPQRARRRGARPRAPRLAGTRAAPPGRVRPQGRPAARHRRDEQPRARHRHGRGRPRRARGVAGIGVARSAAHRPCRPQRRRTEHRQDLPEVPRRPPGDRDRRGAHARRTRGGDALPAQPARRARPADRGRHRNRRVGRRRPPRAACGAPRTSPSSPTTCSARPSTCSRAATRPISSRACGRGSVWDRAQNRVRAREGAQHVAIASGGTIPDRGLFGVFLPDGARVGELDEEMVYESRVGEAFVLGASTWRIEEITFDRVVVVPAPGEPAKTPFWKGDKPGRPLELGRAMGALVRELRDAPEEAPDKLAAAGLDERASSNLRAYLSEQAEATGAVPDDRTIVIERFADEIGDWRVCILTPFGARVHAPWALAIEEKLARLDLPVQVLWSDDGIICRLPESLDEIPLDVLLVDPEELDELVVTRVPSTSLFASRFRENAARALLLPRRRPGERTPLWQQRQRAAGLLEVASGYPTFPILLETTRECLRDVFDLPALREVLTDVRSRRVRVVPVETRHASPVRAEPLVRLDRGLHVRGRRAARRAPRGRTRARPRPPARPARRGRAARAARSGGDRRVGARAPTAHPRTQGPPRRRPPRPARRPRSARRRRAPRPGLRPNRAHGSKRCSSERRIIRVGHQLAAVEDAARLRDALGLAIPPVCPSRSPIPCPNRSTISIARYARTHVPFVIDEAVARLGVTAERALASLSRLEAAGRVVHGEFRPGGQEREWCDAGVLRSLRRRSLAALRHEVEPVDADHVRSLPRRLARDRPGPPRHRRARRGDRATARCRDPGVGARARRAARARRGLPARDARRAVRGRRARLDGRRRARSRRRTRAASSSATGSSCSRLRWCSPEPPDGPLHDAIREQLRPCRRVVLARDLAPPRAPPTKPCCSPRSGISCGRARSPTTRSGRCGFRAGRQQALEPGPAPSRSAHAARAARRRGPLVTRRAAPRPRTLTDRDRARHRACNSSNATAS